MCQEANLIVAISENTKNDVLKFYGIKPEKVKVVYNGINKTFFQPITDPEKERVKNKFNLPKDYLFYLGNLEPRKNVESLILAFDELKNQNIELLIAGALAWKYKKIYQLWQKAKNKDRIKFLGYVDKADRPALYGLAKLFVYPSIYEGFGLPPLEAMACGTPVVTSFNSSLVEAVGEAGLLVDPNNFKEIAAIIDKFLGDENLQKTLKEKGLSWSRQFTWQKTSSQILEIIQTNL